MSEARSTRIEAVDQTLARLLNELRIVTLLRRHGATSRAEIARRLGVTPATVTRLSNGLIAQGLADEEKAVRRSKADLREIGRPAGRVSLRPDGAFFVGVEIGVGVFRFAVIDLLAHVVRQHEIRCPDGPSPDTAVDTIGNHLRDLLADRRFSGRIRSLGVTVPGLVTAQGLVINLPILGWKGVDLRAALSRAVPIPCLVENNANAAAFGAVYTQPSLVDPSILFLKLGVGCGGAAIIQGRLLKGANGLATELGHMRLAEGGTRCHCGQTGCLESWVNLDALARYYGEADDDLASLPDRVAAEAKRGASRATTACETFAYWLARGLASLTNVFNPSVILLGGMLRPVIAQVLPDLRSQVPRLIIPGLTVPAIALSGLDRFECALGAATIAHHQAFDISSMEIVGDGTSLAAGA